MVTEFPVTAKFAWYTNTRLPSRLLYLSQVYFVSVVRLVVHWYPLASKLLSQLNTTTLIWFPLETKTIWLILSATLIYLKCWKCKFSTNHFHCRFFRFYLEFYNCRRVFSTSFIKQSQSYFFLVISELEVPTSVVVFFSYTIPCVKNYFVFIP